MALLYAKQVHQDSSPYAGNTRFPASSYFWCFLLSEDVYNKPYKESSSCLIIPVFFSAIPSPCKPLCSFNSLHFSHFLFFCLYTPPQVQEQTCGGKFYLLIIRILGVKLRLSVLVASTFTLWASGLNFKVLNGFYFFISTQLLDPNFCSINVCLIGF